jgi:hypothetical protein
MLIGDKKSQKEKTASRFFHVAGAGMRPPLLLNAAD